MELFFLLCFSFHNIEEGLWLPGWSKYAEKYHAEVTKPEFCFAVIVVTLAGYLITFAFLLFGAEPAIRNLYLGFVLMMSLNAIFPHLIATVVLKRYAPGTLTGVLLNLPVGITILVNHTQQGVPMVSVLLSGIIVTVLTVMSLRPLFKLGKKLIRDY